MGCTSSAIRRQPKMDVSSEYISIGGNRNPAAADWDEAGSQLLAFGADNCIALWNPQVSLTNHSKSQLTK